MKPGWAPEAGVSSSQLLALERLRLHLEPSVCIILWCSHVCQKRVAYAQGRDKDWEGHFFPTAACGLAAYLSPCLSSPADFFQACFLSTADSPSYNGEQAAMQITCKAAGPLLGALQ